MARTSKKRQATVPVKKDKIYSVGIYARLSVDGTERKNESIDNQLELCREYVRSHEDMEIFCKPLGLTPSYDGMAVTL